MDPIYFNIFEPSEWIRYITIYFNLPSECNIWLADKPPIYLQKSFISTKRVIQNSPKRLNTKSGWLPGALVGSHGPWLASSGLGWLSQRGSRFLKVCT